MTTLDTCHICLESMEYQVDSLIKDCCSAFICNSCWQELLTNPLIRKCPICNSSFNNETVIIYQEVSSFDIFKEYFRRCLLIIKWITIGFLITCMIVAIIYQDIDDITETIDFLCFHPYFWPLCMVYGYFITCVFENCFDMQCHSWYN